MAPHDRPQANRPAVPRFDHRVFHGRRVGGFDDPPRTDGAEGHTDGERHLQQDFHHARRGDGVLLPHPDDPGHAGELPDPHDDRRARSRVSPTQSAELVRVRRSGRPCGHRHAHRRRRHGLDVLHALQQHLQQLASRLDDRRRVPCRVFLDLHGDQFHCYDPQDARAGTHLVSASALRLGALRNQRRHHPRHPGHRNHAPHARGREGSQTGVLQPRTGRRPRAVSAPLLVLFAPRRLHHDPARVQRDERAHHVLFSAQDIRLQLHRVLLARHWGAGVSGVGPPPLRQRPVDVPRDGLLDHLVPRRSAFSDQDFQLGYDHLQRQRQIQHADVLRHRVHGALLDRRPDRALPLVDGHRHPPP
ncbi:MAG: hypothetical protein CNCCGFBP_00935 [Fimbriimonadaceae bacterium]|nr:hypothetical protein [Fimbriimonadaceae bacterium]